MLKVRENRSNRLINLSQLNMCKTLINSHFYLVLRSQNRIIHYKQMLTMKIKLKVGTLLPNSHCAVLLSVNLYLGLQPYVFPFAPRRIERRIDLNMMPINCTNTWRLNRAKCTFLVVMLLSFTVSDEITLF